MTPHGGGARRVDDALEREAVIVAALEHDSWRAPNTEDVLFGAIAALRAKQGGGRMEGAHDGHARDIALSAYHRAKATGCVAVIVFWPVPGNLGSASFMVTEALLRHAERDAVTLSIGGQVAGAFRELERTRKPGGGDAAKSL